VSAPTARRNLAAAVAVGALGAAYVAIGLLWRYTDSPQSIVAYDFYGQFYPWRVHVRRALTAGGLFWNPYQDCGQPFDVILYLKSLIRSESGRETVWLLPAPITCVGNVPPVA
jgi:hypothetical protein